MLVTISLLTALMHCAQRTVTILQMDSQIEKSMLMVDVRYQLIIQLDVPYHIHSSPPPDSVLKHMNPVYNFPLHLRSIWTLYGYL